MVFDSSLGSDTRAKRPNPVSIPCTVDKSVGVHSSSCTLCGFTGSASAYADHSCFANPGSNFHPDDRVEDRVNFDSPLDKPNRFDPFKALDLISKWTQADYSPEIADFVARQILGLRAYITGMER